MWLLRKSPRRSALILTIVSRDVERAILDGPNPAAGTLAGNRTGPDTEARLIRASRSFAQR
jgi:hypothetical protein